MMPEMTGIDLYRRLESKAPHRVERMVFMTGGAFTPEAGAFADAMKTRLIEKPIEEARLRSFVAEKLAV